MLRVFIGYDKAEVAAYQVASYSIIKNSSVPVSITPLKIDHFPGFTNAHPLQSTDFAFTRFLVPWLSEYKGHSLFIDADMLVLGDIANLFTHANDEHAVHVVKHDYKPDARNKFLNQKQTVYNRKNWSSVILFNNELCKGLTFDYVNKANGLDLHQFRWLEDEQIGELPKTWNWLVGEDGYAPHDVKFEPNIIHYTKGGPYFSDYTYCDYAQNWNDYFAETCTVLDKKIIYPMQPNLIGGMGNV